MSTWKKIGLGFVGLLLIAGAVIYYFNSKDHYDPSKYEATITHTEQADGEHADDRKPDGEQAGGLKKGTHIKLTLPDQFDVSHSIGPEVKTLILAFSKGTGGTVRAFLDEKPGSFLSDNNAAFIADISPFPVVLRNTIALPMLRSSSYPVLLLYEDTMSEALKNTEQEDKITVATLAQGVVSEVRYISDEAELAQVFRSQD